MRTIVIMNNKGGVGKTVTAINLADLLHRAGKTVLLVDCDGQMSATRFFFPDLDPDNTLTLADVLCNTHEPAWYENTVPIHVRWHLLPASSALYSLDVAAMKGDAPVLGNLRDFCEVAAEDGVDYTIIDCPPGFTVATTAALIAADEVVIPMLIDGFSFWGMEDMRRCISDIRSINPRIKIAGVLVCQWHNAPVIAEGETLLRSLGVPVFNTVIRRTDKMPESTLQREAICTYSPRSAAGIDYRAFVQEYLHEEVQ